MDKLRRERVAQQNQLAKQEYAYDISNTVLANKNLVTPPDPNVAFDKRKIRLEPRPIVAVGSGVVGGSAGGVHNQALIDEAYQLGYQHRKEFNELIAKKYGGGMTGGGIFDAFKKGWGAYRTVTKALRPAAEMIGVVGGPKAKVLASAFLTGDKLADQIDPIVGNGKRAYGKVASGRIASGRIASGKPDKRKMRGEMIRDLMRNKGMTLPEASAYLKNSGK